jgi:hypothetical protein
MNPKPLVRLLLGIENYPFLRIPDYPMAYFGISVPIGAHVEDCVRFYGSTGLTLLEPR